MKFAYKKYFASSGTLRRPVIAIEVKNPLNERHTRYEVLVDSGSDICIFDTQLGEVIGFAFGKHNQTGKVRGITGTPQDVYGEQIEIIVGGQSWTIDAYFMKLSKGSRYGVVGQEGFFDLFMVKFDLLKEEIELKPRK
jgi:hypothetical protein